MTQKPIVTISGKKTLFKSELHQRITQDLPQEGIEWRRRLDSNTKSVYIDVEFVDFDVENVESSSERLNRLRICDSSISGKADGKIIEKTDDTIVIETIGADGNSSTHTNEEKSDVIEQDNNNSTVLSNGSEKQQSSNADVSRAFFNQKLLGRPILHTYWADKSDFEDENQKSQFDDWIGNVQASSCTEWAIIIVEDGDFKAQLGTALFKSKLQSTTSQPNASSSSSSQTQSSFLDKMKKGLSTIFQSDSNSDKWLTLINQDRLPDIKAQESYSNFLKKLRNLIMNSFSKQFELFEEQLRVQRELRNDKNWDFFSYFSMQEELAFAFEFLTLFDEALVQYDLLDALYTEYISSANFNPENEPSYSQWTSLNSWRGLCLDMNNSHMKELRQRIGEKKASLLDLRNYLFSKQCDLMLMQNEPWRVAASASLFIQNCIREHEFLKIEVFPGALACWAFTSALEVLQKCECYSCTSTMENYSFHTVDLWNCARMKLLELGSLCHQLPSMDFNEDSAKRIKALLEGLGADPHGGVSYESKEISPYARLKDALNGKDHFSKHLIEISQLTLGTYKHIGRRRHALLVGKELADFYIAQGNTRRALPFVRDFERMLKLENWTPLVIDVHKIIEVCNKTDSSDGSKNADSRL